MVRQVFLGTLLLVLAAAACVVVARPAEKGGCQRKASPLAALHRFMRRSAALATGLRSLRQAGRQRRMRAGLVPVSAWGSLHRLQGRTKTSVMDVSRLVPADSPPLLPSGEAEPPAAAGIGWGLVDENPSSPETGQGQGRERDGGFGLPGPVREEGFWLGEPVPFPDVALRPPARPETPAAGVGGWGPAIEIGGWGQPVAEVLPPAAPENPQESFVEGWGAYRDPCSDDIAGTPCVRHSDCPGCRLFHCSAHTNTCQAGPAPETHLDGFF